MRAKKLESCRRQLSSAAPWIGPWLRRRAIRALAKNGTPEATRTLAEFAAHCTDDRLLVLALDALKKITSPLSVDSICAVWAVGRRPILAELITSKDWIASTPAQVRVLTALKARRFEVVLGGGAEVIGPLIETCADGDHDIAQRARECLGSLRNPAAIDALCVRWMQKRERPVTAALERGGYVAQKPLVTRVWTALKAGRRELVTVCGPEVIEPLIEAGKDPEPLIAQRAAEALRELTDPQAQEALCRCVIEGDEATARQAALAARYAPREPLQRAVFYFLTEQWDAYESLDFDHRWLGSVYEAGSKKLRCRIAEKGRQCGRTEWLTAIVGARHDRRLSDMSDEEWEAAVAVLGENKRWEDSWQLAQVAPADWSARLLAQLGNSGWSPRDERNRESFGHLVRLIDGCREEPPFLGRLMRSASLLEGHSDAISCLAVSRDGSMLASGSNDRTVRLWNLRDGTPYKTLAGHTDWVDCLALSQNDRVLASGSRDKTVCLWSWPEGTLLQKLCEHTDEIRCLAFGPDHRLLATGSSDTTVRLWSVSDGRAIGLLAGHSDIVSCLAISPDGHLLASGSYDNEVRLWSLPYGQLISTLKGHRAMVNCLAFNAAGLELISGSKDRSLIIWNIPERVKLKRLKGHRDDVACLAVHPNSELLASGSWDTTIRLWRLSDGEALDTLGATGTNDGHSGWVSCLTFSPDGKVLASGGFDHMVRLWSVPGGAPLKALEDHRDKVTCLCFAPDGRTLISGSADRTIRVWRSELARLRRLPIGQITLEDSEWVENVLSNSRLSDAERGWMEFLFALMRSRRRYDIELGEAARILVGEFDIELEG